MTIYNQTPLKNVFTVGNQLQDKNKERFEIVKVTNPNDQLIDKYYEGFSKIFTLPEIRRSKEGLKLWMSTNQNPALQQENGPTEHSILMLVDKENGNVVGGWDSVKFTTEGLTEEQTNGYRGGTQGTYVWIAEGYRKRDGLGTDLLTTLKDAAKKDAEEWVCGQTGQDTTDRTFTFFEQEDVTRLTTEQREEDMDASKVDPVSRLFAFMNGMGAKILSDPKGGGWYAQTAYPEVDDDVIDQDAVADYLLLTGLWPKGRQPTNHIMARGIRSVAGVLATDNGRFKTSDHNVIQRMEKHLSGKTRQMNLVEQRAPLTFLRERTKQLAQRAANDNHPDATFGQRLGVMPIDDPKFAPQTMSHDPNHPKIGQ